MRICFPIPTISRRHTGLEILLLSLMSGFNEDNMASHAQHKPG
ncbi:hypothetical protein I3843_03G244600 [Carya illinoinensis]|nr:hypothetical protein I3843_03G244600 [Carya illinoinensis]